MAPRLSRALLLALPVVGLGELGAHLWFAHRPPTFEEWSTIREPVLGFADAAAPLFVAPRWAEPMARATFGDERMPIAHVARPDVDRFDRAVELSILGERAPEAEGWIEEAREQHGKFLLRRLRNPRHRPVVTDFVARARPPFAEVFTTSPRAACPWNDNAKTMSGGLSGNPTFPRERFECPAGIFFNVGATVLADQDFHARRCLWSHPPKAGEVVTRFADVSLGATIEGHTGLNWMLERTGRGGPIVLTVRVDGEEVGRVEHLDGQGWAPFSFPLGAHANKPHAAVELAASARDYLHRHFCFEATSR